VGEDRKALLLLRTTMTMTMTLAAVALRCVAFAGGRAATIIRSERKAASSERGLVGRTSACGPVLNDTLAPRSFRI
jgi:hypothetical protein